MRELDCDFCGARAAGAFEVLPAELDPTPDEQVRMVLCENCRDTLDAVTAPLLARLGVGNGGADRPSEGSPTSPSRSPSTAEGGSENDGPEDGAQASARSENPVSPADDAVIIDSGARRKPGSTDDRRGSADAGATDASPRGDGPDEGDDTDGTDEGDGTGGSGERDGGDEANGPDATPDGDSSPSDGETVRQRAEEPEEFRTVMRLLNNREFPVDRTEIVDLASGAYELEASQVEKIIDYAVERGILAEQKGKLTKA